MPTPRDGTVPVCRFFTVAFPPKSSHFYTADAAECAKLKTNPDWIFEAEVFHALLPADRWHVRGGYDPRLPALQQFQGGAPNHRYTTDLAVRAAMIAQDYLPEGTGIGVTLCVPQ